MQLLIGHGQVPTIMPEASILLEISALVSSSYSNALPETGELQNISQ